jgi:REP-associated tyrosine transposase
VFDQERYRKGSHTITELKYHFVWKTKYSYRILKGDLALRLREIVKEIASEKEMVIMKGHVRPDHVHILISAPTHLSVSKMAQILKGKSSFRLQKEFPELRKRYWGQHLWARGYFCSTVGAVTEELIKRYIEDQEEENGNFKIWDEKKRLSKKLLTKLVNSFQEF